MQYDWDEDEDLDAEEDKEKQAIANRANKNDRIVIKTLKVIVRKNKELLTLSDKQFLKARASYLSDGQRREYADVIAADYSGQGDAKEAPAQIKLTLEDMTRNELEEKARGLKIPEPQVFPNKTALIEAIVAAQNEEE